jgi:hypothetical protein
MRPRTAVLALLVALASPAGAHTLVALTEDGTLIVFGAERPAATAKLKPTGVSGRLAGIDTRPADGHLYGISTSNDVYRIDPRTGAATLVSSLTAPFDGADRSGVDFTPQLDRLRLLGADGQNLRVNVDLGATATDPPLTYAPGDANAGRRPRITAAAYTNAVSGAGTTRLLEIDAEVDVLVLQEPANDGVLRTIGPLGVDFGPRGGFDIVTEGGKDEGYAASGATLYTVDLERGGLRALGSIGDGSASIVSLAVSREAPAPPPAP